MLKDVDKLPGSTEWLYQTIEVPSDGDNPPCEIEFYYRNPVELVKEIIGNPTFNQPDAMAYEPVEIWVEGKNGEKVREYSEAWTADWWNEMQVCFKSME